MSSKLSISFIFICGLIFFSACNNSDPDQEKISNNFDYSADSDELTSGVQAKDEVLNFEVKTQLDYTLTPPIEIDPIQKEGLKRIMTVDGLAGGLKVSDACFWKQYIFISYSDPSQKYGGVVDVYSTDDVPHIQRIARFSFNETGNRAGIDILAASYQPGYLVLACSSAEKPAFIEQIAYNPDENSEPEAKNITDIPATDLLSIIAVDDKVIALAGQGDAGVYIFQAVSMAKEQFIPVQQPLSMSYVPASNEVAVLQNTSPVKYTKISLAGETGNPVSVNVDAQSTTKGIASKDKIFVRSGNQIQIFNRDGSAKQLFALTGETSGSQVIHHKNVSVMKDWLLMLGNDGNGLRACGLRNRPEVDVTEISNLVNAGQSLSFLASNDYLAVIADQNGALQILWRVSVGMPEIPVYVQDIEEIKDILTNAFWGSRNNYKMYQNLFVSDISGTVLHPDLPLTIKVLNKTKIYISIAKQGASIASSFGYYPFGSSSLPANASGLDKVIIFPNTQTVESIGNTVPLCDKDGNMIEFNPGQEIGFYFIRGGWSTSVNNGMGGVDENQTTMYTHKKYNTNQFQQHVFFRLKNQNPLFMGFEDTMISTTNITEQEPDFDDFMISISDNMENAPIVNLSIEGVPVIDY